MALKSATSSSSSSMPFSYSSNEVYTRNPLLAFTANGGARAIHHLPPSPTAAAVAVSRQLAASSRNSEAFKYSEFLPKLVEERQRLEIELKLLINHHRAVKKRRRMIQKLTKERVLKIQQIKGTQTVPSTSGRHATENFMDKAKRQVRIVAPKETHGVLSLLGLSNSTLNIKDRNRRNKISVETDATMEAGKLAMTGGIVRATTSNTPKANTPGKSPSSSPTATQGGTPAFSPSTSPRGASANTIIQPSNPPHRDSDAEGRRFFGSNKYRKYEMDVMKDDGFADLFSKFQASKLGEEDENEDEDDDGRQKQPVINVSAAGGDSECKEKDANKYRTEESADEKSSGEEHSESDRDRKGCDEAVEDSVSSSLLGSFIVVQRDYRRRLSEFDEKFKQKMSASTSANHTIMELQDMLAQLRREQAELRTRVQTSQDDAQLLESFSAGVSLFEKKKEDEDTVMDDDRDGKRGCEEDTNKPNLQTKEEIEKKTENDDFMLFTKKTNALAEYGMESIVSSPQCSVSEFSGAATATTEDENEEGKRLRRSGKKKRNAGKGATQRKKRKDKSKPGREILLKAYHEIPYEELHFDPTPLGNGAFGVVYKAFWRGTAVAVKKLMVMQFTEAEVYNFKREASIMEKFSNHPNILKFCGITTKFPHYCIVTEYMERGCARDALAQNPNLPWKTLVGMAVDAAAGILHLHAEHIVHRDLALRNMLVGKDWRIRVADFGLARMMPKDTYAKTRGNIGAVRWLAPEVITKSVYSEKSDSYAFGIVMWELLARGEEPFSDKTNVMEIALGIINEGLRPTMPKGVPDEYKQLMTECWAKNVDDRPDFVMIHKRLAAYYATLS